jgi:hypothetical protein
MIITKFCLYTYFRSTFVSLRGNDYLQRSSHHAANALRLNHEHQLVFSVSRMVWVLHLVAHIEVLGLKELTCAEQKMTLAQSVFRTELKR